MEGMFCYQCEQTAAGKGCEKRGVCGKDFQSSNLMDMLIEICRGISWYANIAYQKNQASSSEVNRFVIESLFTTVTNVNFDSEDLANCVNKALEVKEIAKKLCGSACVCEPVCNCAPVCECDDNIPAACKYIPHSKSSIDEDDISHIPFNKNKFGEDVAGLLSTILFGLKGAAAYADHAKILGFEDDAIYAKFNSILAFTANDSFTADELLAKVLETGELNLLVMQLLDKANTETYGNPEPTNVKITPTKGKAILISGHDLKDLYNLLLQTKGTGVNIYTHGEMLPANAYPKLKEFSHLAGHYGTAWQNQQKEFDEFPGSILMTTNCIQAPKLTYKDRIFTTGLVEFPGVTHISDYNFKPLIDSALASEGFTEDVPEKTITIGFAQNAVMSVAGKVIDAVKAGQIKHFFLVGGCDGAKPGRNYYTELAEKIPSDCVILTLACGKFRFNRQEFGDIGGIPRLLDVGQCNDAYSAIQIAVALANAFECGVNDLPLSLILSWYEQKAVAILLTLLYLGIKDIRLGPSLPAFITPAVLDILVEKFGIKPITTPDEDLKAILG